MIIICLPKFLWGHKNKQMAGEIGGQARHMEWFGKIDYYLSSCQALIGGERIMPYSDHNSLQHDQCM